MGAILAVANMLYKNGRLIEAVHTKNLQTNCLFFSFNLCGLKNLVQIIHKLLPQDTYESSTAKDLLAGLVTVSRSDWLLQLTVSIHLQCKGACSVVSEGLGQVTLHLSTQASWNMMGFKLERRSATGLVWAGLCIQLWLNQTPNCRSESPFSPQMWGKCHLC